MQDVVGYLRTTTPHLCVHEGVCVALEWHHIQYYYTSGLSRSRACKAHKQTHTHGVTDAEKSHSLENSPATRTVGLTL